MAECIFCKIAAGQIPARIVHQDDQAVVFEDLNPQAPVHLLIIPRKHFMSLNEAAAEDRDVLGHIHLLAAKVAAMRGISDGFRTVLNNGARAGQTVSHLHLHVLGGRQMTWPPG